MDDRELENAQGEAARIADERERATAGRRQMSERFRKGFWRGYRIAAFAWVLGMIPVLAWKWMDTHKPRQVCKCEVSTAADVDRNLDSLLLYLENPANNPQRPPVLRTRPPIIGGGP